jgi:hypothetical protein
VTDRWRIRQRYLTRECLVDLVALIPMDVFAYLAGLPGEVVCGLRFLKLVACR